MTLTCRGDQEQVHHVAAQMLPAHVSKAVRKETPVRERRCNLKRPAWMHGEKIVTHDDARGRERGVAHKHTRAQEQEAEGQRTVNIDEAQGSRDDGEGALELPPPPCNHCIEPPLRVLEKRCTPHSCPKPLQTVATRLLESTSKVDFRSCSNRDRLPLARAQPRHVVVDWLAALCTAPADATPAHSWGRGNVGHVLGRSAPGPLQRQGES